MSASQHRLYFLLQRVAHRLKTEADQALAQASGLTTAQSAALNIIATDGPMTQKRVATALSQRESAITAMATRLLEAGYITRDRSQTDGRAWELAVTARGRQALARVKKPFDRINAVLDQHMSTDEVELIAQRFGEVLAALEEEKPRSPQARGVREWG